MPGLSDILILPVRLAHLHIERKFGVFDPVMDPTRESTYKFLDAFIAEMVAISPDPFFHIGGDENNGVEWKASPRIQSFMREHNLKDTSALQNYFNQRLLKILEKHGKHMIGWDEDSHTPDLPQDVMVQSWRGFDSLAAGARNGYTGILSAGYYLNLMSPASKQFYMVDPLPQTTDSSPPSSRRGILGGEACMWMEQTSPVDIDSRVWLANRGASPNDSGLRASSMTWTTCTVRAQCRVVATRSLWPHSPLSGRP